MITRTNSAFLLGISGQQTTVEAADQPLPPQIQITGLPNEAIRESRDRIRVALSLLNLDLPRQKLVVHLSPASVKKAGNQFDLPIALALLSAEGYLPTERLRWGAYFGELGMDGSLKRVPSIIPLVRACLLQKDIKEVVVPLANEGEVSLMRSERVRCANHLSDVIAWLKEDKMLPLPKVSESIVPKLQGTTIDEIFGNELAKRALEIAMAGRHPLLLIGPPGVGKTMLGQCAARLLPPLEDEEFVELCSIQSVGKYCSDFEFTRPFRAPHPSISVQGFVGGGSGQVLPGEVTLSHFGVLFLDEFPEFRRDVVEGLREPLQSGRVNIHRLGSHFDFPAKFFLVASMNPCPCGFSLSSTRRCVCPRQKVVQYRKRVSGAILDRFDLGVILTDSKVEKGNHFIVENEIRDRISRAWQFQQQRYGKLSWNADMGAPTEHLNFDPSARRILKDLRAHSTRSLVKIQKVARTIADLEGLSTVSETHIREAEALRCPNLYEI